MNKLFFCLLLCLIWGSCGEEKPQNEPSSVAQPTLKKENTPSSIVLKANMDHLRMRDGAGTDGKILGNFSMGDELIYQGERSDFTTAVNLRGYPYEEYWLKIKTKDGQEGWVYGGGVTFGEDLEADLVKPLVDNRLSKLFGKKLFAEIQDYQLNYKKAATSEELAATYRQASVLRDELVKILHNDIEVTDPQKTVDMTWLEASMPGFIKQLVAEGTMFTLFFYYEDWLKKAQRTKGNEDNNFFYFKQSITLS